MPTSRAKSAAAKIAHLEKVTLVTGDDLARPLISSMGPPLNRADWKPQAPSALDEVWRWRRSPEQQFAALRARLLPSTSKQPTDLMELAANVGFEELSGPVAGALRYLSRHCRIKHSRRVTKIPVDRILSWVWRHGRVLRNIELAVKGGKPPPITVTEIRFGREIFYLVYDGNHRSEVAKIRGEDRIAAVIQQTLVFEPRRWILCRNGVRSTAGKFMKLPVDQLAAAKWLGIRGEPSARS